MPANRSRTSGWRRCLKQILDRGGSIEIAVSRQYEAKDAGRHLVWRVRLLDYREGEVLVEQPVALGRTIPLKVGVELAATFSIGQNRWMFSTTILEEKSSSGSLSRRVKTMRLRLPDEVQRCQRRDHNRVSTASINLPQVDLWPLLDPKSVIVAERANEIRFQSEVRGELDSNPTADNEMSLPEVGPQFSGDLINLGGGGVGLHISPDEAKFLARHKVFWMRINLPPDLKTPICVTGKLVHAHIESSQDTYAGMVFDFTFNHGHEQTVIDQICAFSSAQQRSQSERREKETSSS